MKRDNDHLRMTKRLSDAMPEAVSARLQHFCAQVLGKQTGALPSVQGIFMKQNLSILVHATIVFLLTNGFYLVKNLLLRTTIPIDMVPLYMMVASSLAMLVFSLRCRRYDGQAARLALLAYYFVIIASVAVFMVSCNFHGIGLSISMCYLFVIMIAPPCQLADTVLVCLLIAVSWWLPKVLPYAENYDLFKHFLLRFSIVAGFLATRSVFLRQAGNERDLAELNRAYALLAYNDTVTGALTRKALELYRVFLAEVLQPERISGIICDIDDFKSYNDHYSHVAGDAVLKQVAGSMLAALERDDCYLFRFGGEEFAVLLPEADEEEACRVARRLLEAVRAAAIPREDIPGSPIVTASFGVASGTPAEMRDRSLMIRADGQLYLCKSSGKNCVALRGKIFR